MAECEVCTERNRRLYRKSDTPRCCAIRVDSRTTNKILCAMLGGEV
jgi:hypothetical protein